MADVRRLVELGMVPPLAKEVSSQITSGVGNARRLAELSMVPSLAGELAAQITAKVGNVRRLAELTMVPVLAMEVAGQVGGGVVPPVGPVAFLLPTPAFSAANGVSWHDFSKTYKNSVGVDQPSLNKDLVGYSSASSWLDMFGQGNELSQPDKALQPLVGSTGPVNDAIGHPLVFSNGGQLTGKNKVSFWFRLKPRADLYTGSAKRTLIYISKGPTSAILLGTPTVALGGAGYNVGEYIILTGGTASTQVILKVASVSAGVVTSVSVVNQGAYTVVPTSPVSQGSSSGAGIGATFNAVFSTIGTGSANERFAVYMTGGTNRRLYVAMSVGDGTVETTSTTLGPQVPDNVFSTVGVEVDIAAQTANFYLNSTTPTYQVTGFPAATGTFGTRDSVLSQIGDNSNNSSTAYSEWAAQVLFSDTSDSTRLAALKSYLDGVAP